MEDYRLVKKISPSLRNQFWTNFMDCIDEEFQAFKSDRIDQKINLYNVSKMDYTRLREISSVLGVVFDASINSTTNFLKREVEAIPFKIKYKSTVLLYLSFAKALSRMSEFYVYYFKASSDSLIRNTVGLLLNMNSHDPKEPYVHASTGEYTGTIEDVLQLDTGLYLDIENEGEIWTLDTVESVISTNHIGLEIFIDEIIAKQVRNDDDDLESKEFLMTWEYMDFLQVNTDFSRRVKEVPHVGCQLTAICDSSGVYDKLSDPTMPDIKLNALTTSDFSDLLSVLNLSYVEFGIGSLTNLKSKNGSGSSPTELDQRVARNFILFDEKYENQNWMGVVAEYRGQQINRFLLHDQSGYQLNDSYGQGKVNGSNNDFRGTLLFAPIQKGNVRFVFYSDDVLYEIVDDQKGLLIGNGAYGTIDYTTGKYQFSTDIDYQADEAVATGDGSTKEFDIELGLPSPIQSEATSDPEDPHVWVVYNIGNRTYITKDDGLGHITGTKIASGSVDYEHGTAHLKFTEPITEDEDITLQYQYNKITTPDVDTEIKVDYYFTIRSIEITEAGVYNEDDELIAYATFPPVEFTSARNHLSMAFIIKKSNF